MSLSRLAAKCRACPKLDICDHKEMEAFGVLPLPEPTISVDMDWTKMETSIDPNQMPEPIMKQIVHQFQKSKQMLRG